MAAMPAFEESRCVGETDACEYVRLDFVLSFSCSYLGFCSIRFAPPLVISEEDLLKAVRIIGKCLEDLDKV